MGRGWPEPDKQAGLRGLALHETSPRARAWAVGAARGLTRHGPLRSRAGPGTARRCSGQGGPERGPGRAARMDIYIAGPLLSCGSGMMLGGFKELIILGK